MSCSKCPTGVLPTSTISVLWWSSKKSTEMRFVAWCLVTNVPTGGKKTQSTDGSNISASPVNVMQVQSTFQTFVTVCFMASIFSACQARCLGQICCHWRGNHAGLPQKVRVNLLRRGGWWFRSSERSRRYGWDYLIREQWCGLPRNLQFTHEMPYFFTSDGIKPDHLSFQQSSIRQPQVTG